MRKIGLIELVGAGVLLMLAWMIPAHLASIDRVVLKEAGEKVGMSVSERIDYYLDRGMSGPARILVQLSGNAAGGQKIESIESRYPHYRFSGGPAPYFEQFLDRIEEPSSARARRSGNLVSVMIDRKSRGSLLSFLVSSSMVPVHEIVRTRELSTVSHFLPVFTAGGGPLDASILATALLIQGKHLPDDMVEELRVLAREALEGNLQAVSHLESFYLGVLSAGNRLNWVQLAEMTRLCGSVSEFNRLGILLRRHPERFPLIYSALMVSRNVTGLIDYLGVYGRHNGFEDISDALLMGEGAIRLLLDYREPIYRPPSWLDLPDSLKIMSGLVLDFPRWSMAIRLIGVFLASYFLIMGIVHLSMRSRQKQVRYWDALPFLRNAFIALLLSTLLVGLLEPGLPESLSEGPSSAGIRISIDAMIHNFGTSAMNSVSTDTTTVVVMMAFFAVQVAIYFICLRKVSSIRAMEGTPEYRQALLENEDQLFDCGLYVGLGGTVASLILLAMDIVSASLVAAYASTLFGILFVAVLKIFHVRPLRRQLIEEAAGPR